MADGPTQPPVVSGLRHPESLEYLGFSPKCLKVVLLNGAEGKSVKEEGGASFRGSGVSEGARGCSGGVQVELRWS